VNWGPDRAPGGGDDIVYNAGQSDSTVLDELFYVGAGNAFWPGSNDPDPSNPLLGRQGSIDANRAYVLANQPFTVSGSYTINGSTGNAYVNVVPEPATLGLIGLAACGMLARRRSRRRQGA